jgi:hypothetical protein
MDLAAPQFWSVGEQTKQEAYTTYFLELELTVLSLLSMC